MDANVLLYAYNVSDPRHSDAASAVSSWLALPTVGVLEPTERHWAILEPLLASTQARGDLVTDAHLAALAIEHGATICTTDRDFARFPGLTVIDPTAR